MVDVVWDMETSDPDDYLTLLLLLDHPQVRLKAVTITPGTTRQVGLVRRTLAEFGQEIPVGAFNLDHPKQCVSRWHEKVYGEIEPSQDAEEGWRVLCGQCDENTTLITGAPLKNPGQAILRSRENEAEFVVGRMVIQGGFAGVGVIPEEQQLEKFRGLTTCPTFNLNGDPQSALAVMAYEGIGLRRLVSKNVCHSVCYDQAVHQRFAEIPQLRKNQRWIYRGMDHYLGKHSQGKLLHDPLAACCAIDETIGDWAEVEVYRERGQWGARLQEGTKTWIITAYHREMFLQTLLA